MELVLENVTKRTFGIERWYPVNEEAKMMCSLKKPKVVTLVKRDIEFAVKAGFQILYKGKKSETLESLGAKKIKRERKK